MTNGLERIKRRGVIIDLDYDKDIGLLKRQVAGFHIVFAISKVPAPLNESLRVGLSVFFYEHERANEQFYATGLHAIEDNYRKQIIIKK